MHPADAAATCGELPVHEFGLVQFQPRKSHHAVTSVSSLDGFVCKLLCGPGLGPGLLENRKELDELVLGGAKTHE